jgi:phosphoribosylglycinamide formyltransferase-1
MADTGNKKRLVILISGRGSNMRSIIDAASRGELDVDIAAVISNRPAAPGLDFAASAGIATQVVDHKSYDSRESFDAAMASTIDSYQPDFVILAGFMRILTAGFVEHYAGRLINIHPSLLPKFKGLHTHERAIEAGEKEHGASVHFVTAELDDGPVILQASVPVLADDNADTLAARVLEQEHLLYPAAIKKLVSTQTE